jgi:hypothetical protein
VPTTHALGQSTLPPRRHRAPAGSTLRTELRDAIDATTAAPQGWPIPPSPRAKMLIRIGQNQWFTAASSACNKPANATS